jgi:hypothetical protein
VFVCAAKSNPSDKTLIFFQGKGHTNGIVAIAVAGDSVLSVAIDDTTRLTPSGREFLFE